MIKKTLMGLAGALLVANAAVAAEPESCKTVRFSDVGWTDITATTALANVVLEGLGYTPRIDILSVPVTYQCLKNGDIDVFLGNWMPTQEADIAPFTADGSVETVRANLEGAKYTLAVPKYLSDEGLKDYADIAKFKDQLDGKIYGIEPGNDGNRLIQKMIDEDAFGLTGFEVIESSEQGMLAEVQRASRSNKADRVPGLGAAPDEHQLRAHLPDRRRRHLRPELRRRHRLHQRPQGLPAGMPERGQVPAEPRLHPADGEPGDGRHPRRRQRRPRTRPRRG